MTKKPRNISSNRLRNNAMFFGQNLPIQLIIKLYCLAFSYEWNIKHLMFHYSYVDSYVDSKYLTTRPSLFLIKLRNYLQKNTMCFLSICSWPSGRKIGQPQYSYLDLYFYSYRHSISIFYGWYYIWHIRLRTIHPNWSPVG